MTKPSRNTPGPISERNDSVEKSGVESLMKKLYYTDEAEDAVLSSVEQRAKQTEVDGDGFRPAIEGESSPFAGVPLFGNVGRNSMTSSHGSKRSSTNSLRMVVQQRIERAALRNKHKSIRGKGGHRRAHTILTDMTAQIGDHMRLSDAFHFKGSHDMDKTFGGEYDSSSNSDNDERSDLNSDDENYKDDKFPDEGLPLLNSHSKMKISERKLKARKLLEKKAFRWKRMRELLDPTLLVKGVFNWFIHSTFMVSIPLFGTSLILFYVFGNPSTPGYIPGNNITFSWFLDFAGECAGWLYIKHFTLSIAHFDLSHTIFLLSMRFVS